MRIEIDEQTCIGAGQCVMSAPEVFDQRDEDAVVVLLLEDPPAEHHAAAGEAAQVCPSGAITVHDE